MVVIVRYFVLLNNYVTLGLQKHVFLIKSGIRHFCVCSGYVSNLRHNYVASWFVNLLYLFLHQIDIINAFLTMTYFSWRWDYVILWYVCITYGNNIEITFRFCSSLWRIFITSQLRYLFVRWATSKTWTRTLDPDTGLVLWKTWTLKNMGNSSIWKND